MANPFDRVANDYQASKDQAAKKATTCANCGHPVDDVPEPNKKNAEAFTKGMETQPDYLANLKKGLGF